MSAPALLPEVRRAAPVRGSLQPLLKGLRGLNCAVRARRQPARGRDLDGQGGRRALKRETVQPQEGKGPHPAREGRPAHQQAACSLEPCLMCRPSDCPHLPPSERAAMHGTTGAHAPHARTLSPPARWPRAQPCAHPRGAGARADFGLARVVLDLHGALMTGGLGTFQWMAPEVLAHQRYSEKADVFSCAAPGAGP